jgi:hypothetical protein
MIDTGRSFLSVFFDIYPEEVLNVFEMLNNQVLVGDGKDIDNE